jgi:cobalt/nickel transport system permease protein
MILFISLIQLFVSFSSDKIYSEIELLGVSNETIIRVVEFQFHSICIVIGTLIFIMSTPFMLAFKSLEKMKLPSWITTVIFFVYRLLFILAQELNRLFIAYRSRYTNLSLVKKVIVLSKISAVYLTRIFERNDRLYHALVSRGFTGTLSLDIPLAWRRSDTLLLLFGSVLLASIAIIF